MVEFQQVCMAYKEKEVLNNVDLTIQDGEFFVLIGSSGCGKTTLLKSINKLLPVQQGTLKINGTPVSQIKVNQLPNLVGYVVQAGGLFPHLTVEENIALVMKVAQYPKEQIHDRVTAMLKMVNLDPALYRNQYPSQLSGGQQQRVGVARAFAVDPPIVLMDEPFSALDPMTRSELQNEIHALQKKTGKTIIFVTHDMDEAIKLADRICIIQSGHIVQCDTPENILKHPANQYVSTFIGENRLWSNPGYIRAADIMRLRPKTVNRGRTVLQALQMMRQGGVDSLLMVDEKEHLLGVVWLTELMEERDGSAPVEDYLSDDYVAVEEDTTLQEIIANIDYDAAGIIPVVDRQRILRGFLTKSSLLATMSRQFVPEQREGERSGGDMRYALSDYLEIYVTKWDELVEEFLRHLSMTSLAVLLALVIGVPLGIFITRHKKLSAVVIAVANVMQSIPCMALLALGIPVFGIGEKLAVFMVFVYAFLPILKNTYTGIAGISPVSLEVARGIGLTRAQQLTRVELPMAVPYVMSGIRIAAVSAVSTMTIAAFAGANGLGWFIVLGMNSRNYPLTLMGAVAASVMALALDFLLGRVEKAVTSEGLLPPDQIKNLSRTVRRRRRNVAWGLCVALIGVSVLSYAALI